MSRFDWSRSCVCMPVCVCLCACLRPWEGWLCKPKLALAVRNERWWQGRAKKQTGIFSRDTYENKCLPNCHKEAVIYDTSTLIGSFFLLLLQNRCFNRFTAWRKKKRNEQTKGSGDLIWRKSYIQLLLTQVTHSKHVGEFKINQLTSTSCVRVCSLWPTKAEHLVRSSEVEFTDGQSCWFNRTPFKRIDQSCCRSKGGVGVTCGIFHQFNPVNTGVLAWYKALLRPNRVEKGPQKGLDSGRI